MRYTSYMSTEQIETMCAACGSHFWQPYDPGKRREYCSNACRQMAYRARGGRASGTRRQSESARQRQEQAGAWAREQARKERERQRGQDRRGSNRGEERTETPEWTKPNRNDTNAQAKARRTCNLLYVRANHANGNGHEGTACREQADRIRAKHGL